MVKNYLDLSRIEKGEMEVHPQEVDLLDELVVPNIEQLNQQAENRGIRICCDVPAGVILRVDPELARIALGNFLSNAIKYGRERSRIEIRARQYNNQVRVSVWNEGAGFGPEQREKLVPQVRPPERRADQAAKRQWFGSVSGKRDSRKAWRQGRRDERAERVGGVLADAAAVGSDKGYSDERPSQSAVGG